MLNLCGLFVDANTRSISSKDSLSYIVHRNSRDSSRTEIVVILKTLTVSVLQGSGELRCAAVEIVYSLASPAVAKATPIAPGRLINSNDRMTADTYFCDLENTCRASFAFIL